jgi:ribulose bisphosphate carboxylase small subunit
MGQIYGVKLLCFTEGDYKYISMHALDSMKKRRVCRILIPGNVLCDTDSII